MKLLQALCRKKTKTTTLIRTPEIPQMWSINTLNKGANPLLILRNEIFENNPEYCKGYATNCFIVFKMKVPREDGLQNLRDEPILKRIEDTIFSSFELDLQSVVPVIITTVGTRQYLIYTNDIGEFRRKLAIIKSRFPDYHFLTCHEPDVNWETYRSYKLLL